MKLPLIVFAFFLSMAAGLADRQNWTREQLLERLDAAVVAEVSEVSKVAEVEDMGPDIYLYAAVLKFDQVLKPHPELPEKEVTVFFHMSPRGAGYRCPPFADLKEKMKGAFYLRYDDALTGSKAFWLESESEVITR